MRQRKHEAHTQSTIRHISHHRYSNCINRQTILEELFRTSLKALLIQKFLPFCCISDSRHFSRFFDFLRGGRSFPMRRSSNNNLQQQQQQQQRIHRQNLGHTIARQRAVSEQRSKDCFQDGSTVVYRRVEDWNDEQSYASCLFLDQHDTVLASDSHGKIDIVRLPSYGPSSDRPRKLGMKLLGDYDTHHSPHSSSPASFKFKSLQGGKAFVVGMPSGKYKVVPTELASTLRHDHGPNLSPLLHRHQCPTSYEGPRRRFFRSLSSHLTLASMLRTKQGKQNFPRDLGRNNDLVEVDSWNQSTGPPNDRTHIMKRILPHFQNTPRSSSLWDFRETTGSTSLIAAHVDSELDCFWLRLMDDRTQNENAVACVDMTSKEDSSPGVEEHITACAFASDFYLATSHLVVRRPVDDGGQSLSRLKIWDIRFMSRRKGGAIGEIVLPPFPTVPSMPLDPSMSVDTDDDSKSYRHSIITALSSPMGNQGTLVATKQYGAQQIEHCVLDLGRLCFTRRIHQGNQSMVHGIASSHNFMACLGGLQTDSIFLYDLNEAHPKPGSRKRALNGNLRQGKVDESGDIDSTWCSSFNPILLDRHGLQTQLSCLALNESGTAVIGGSIDGDLFVWRGN